MGGGQCPGDDDGSGSVSVDELVRFVSNALHGCGARFLDNGDGTISDMETGLMWEKKVALDDAQNHGSPHDANNAYIWAGYCSSESTTSCQPDPTAAAACADGVDGDPDGCGTCADGAGECVDAAPTVWCWVAQLNADVFAGHRDWRLPTSEELRTIVDYERSVAPAVAAAFDGSRCGRECVDLGDPTCSCTDSFTYWSTTSTGGFARAVMFADGTVRDDPKTSLEFPARVRAVRNGS
jgi:hypothetical protein